MIVSRRTFVATAASLSLLTLAACSSSPVDKAEQDATPAAAPTPTPEPAATAPATAAASGSAEFYDGSPVPAIGPDPIYNPEGMQDRPIGAKGAKVIVVEYSSPTCPHCARFAVDVYPAFKTKYVDTGKVTFVLRPFVRNVLDAVVFMLADAAGPGNYANIVEAYFKTMETWAASDKPRDEIEKIALQLGFTKESFEAALTNQTLFDGMDKLRTQALDKFGVTGTPTFFINGKVFPGEQTLDSLSAQIDPLLA